MTVIEENDDASHTQRLADVEERAEARQEVAAYQPRLSVIPFVGSFITPLFHNRIFSQY